MTQKTKWREILLARRKAISNERRQEASLAALNSLKNRGRVLSFSKIGSEIDLSLLNQFLLSEKRLLLVPYKVEILIETPLSEIDCILVPGLGFDRENYRIGYGKGYFDQFLATVGDIPTIGVGFKEQLCDELLPRDTWDIPVKELMLF